jgi:hypothetical protein
VIEFINLFGVPSVITKVKDDIGCKQNQKNKRAILQHPNSALHLNQELKIILLAIHVNAEKKNKKMEDSEN